MNFSDFRREFVSCVETYLIIKGTNIVRTPFRLHKVKYENSHTYDFLRVYVMHTPLRYEPKTFSANVFQAFF